MNTLNARKIAIVYHISDWGTGVKTAFEEKFTDLGGTIVDVEGSSQDNRDYKTQLSKIKSLNPDYIYMPLYPQGGSVAIQQAQDLGIKTKMLGADSWGDTQFIADANKKADILYVAVASNVLPDSFNQKVLAKTGGTEVPTGAPQAYDAAKVLFNAIKIAGVDGDKIAEALHATDYEGISGPIMFDANGDLVGAKYEVKRIANGTATLVE